MISYQWVHIRHKKPFIIIIIKFQPMASAFDDSVFYHHIKTLKCFWCRQGFNPRFLIQPLEILLVELT